MKAALNLNIARALFPDDKILATSSRGDDTDPRSESIRLWDTHMAANRCFARSPYTVNSIVFSSDGKRIISGNNGGGVIIHDVAERLMISSWCRGLCNQAVAAFWNREGQTVPIAIVRKLTDPWCHSPKSITGCILAPEAGAGEFEIRDIEADTRIKDLLLPRSSARFNSSMASSPDGRFLSISTTDANKYGNRIT